MEPTGKAEDEMAKRFDFAAAKTRTKVYTWTLMMIDSNRLKYYIHGELFLGTPEVILSLVFSI
jgi:hypothetical protein